LYKGESTENIEDGLALLNVASKYEVPKLAQHCSELLGRSITAQNALKTYQQALKFKEPQLMERALAWICRYYLSVMVQSSNSKESKSGKAYHISVIGFLIIFQQWLRFRFTQIGGVFESEH